VGYSTVPIRPCDRDAPITLGAGLTCTHLQKSRTLRHRDIFEIPGKIRVLDGDVDRISQLLALGPGATRSVTGRRQRGDCSLPGHTMCRRATGGGYAMLFDVPRSAMSWTNGAPTGDGPEPRHHVKGFALAQAFCQGYRHCRVVDFAEQLLQVLDRLGSASRASRRTGRKDTRRRSVLGRNAAREGDRKVAEGLAGVQRGWAVLGQRMIQPNVF
jgi:hypothetical protein